MADEQTFGPNDWLVDEMYDQYKADPQSVSESWREFFADYQPELETPTNGTSGTSNGSGNGHAAVASPIAAKAAEPIVPAPAAAAPAPAAPSAPAAAPSAAPAEKPKATAPEGAKVLAGASKLIADNMTRSLTVPTATSFREVPARLLEVNRKVINNYLARTRGGKISFTHLIGYGIIKALKAVPALNNTYVEVDGKPHIVRNEHIGLGLAVDVEKSDGSRTLLVPVIKNAESLDFRAYWQAYDELIRKVKTNKISADDFAGATVTLTNPGTLGTVQSVPRLMPGQGAIIGAGNLDYPAEWQAADPRKLAELGVSKVIHLTSTYDHRIIQGAESGLFLQHLHRYLLGEDGFYDEIFTSLGVPYEAVKWRRDVNPVDRERSQLEKQMHVQTLINMYRVRGHLMADLDPLKAKPPHMHAELDPATYGLTVWDNDREFLTDNLAGHDAMTLGDILGVLRDAYCRTAGVEYMHIQEPDQKRWIQTHTEGVKRSLSREEQLHILDRLNAAEALEKFLETKYIGAKRFGLEGGESAIVLTDAILDAAAAEGLDEAVIGMAHRGRLNVLINIVGKSYGQLFKEFEGNLDPTQAQGSGDVKYHKGFTGTHTGVSGKPIKVSLSSNPSHLEAVDPVVEGMARAKQDILDQGIRYPVLPVLLHGDAAFAGQGVVAETLNMSALRGYQTGGTIHVVINNQVGFTTNPDSSRSSVYCTDVAKMVQAPIFHVNGDDPEACAWVARLAFAFRQAFHKDVVIDMVCYRKFGHNEQDDPSLTQPLMYEKIKNRRSVRKRYVEALIRRGDITMDEAEAAMSAFSAKLQAALEETRATAPPKVAELPPPPPPAPVQPPVETGVAEDDLQKVATALFEAPPGFTVHPKLTKVFETRAKLWAGGEADWAMGEALAFGSLLLEGTDVRMTGQDTRRGTFGHRNACLVDYHTEAEYLPLQHVAPAGQQGRFFIYDSMLSEYAALGFEYGYAAIRPESLVIWEAQFGDFFNGAQIIVDQFLVAAEPKWGQHNGLVMLLPHGYEGQGPEHSSGRIERFLTACAEDNIQVVDCTTASQLFHVLRRQVRGEVRKPLVVFTPKAYLRGKEAYSPVSEFTSGSFKEVLDDPHVSDPSVVKRVVLATGKVAFDAMKERASRLAAGAAPEVAIVRVEQLYPFPADLIAATVARYERADEVMWLQEEPANMGARSYMFGRLIRLLGEDYKVTQASRHESGSPATGSQAMHALEFDALMDQALTV